MNLEKLFLNMVIHGGRSLFDYAIETSDVSPADKKLRLEAVEAIHEGATKFVGSLDFPAVPASPRLVVLGPPTLTVRGVS